ncbi:MAG: GAF domain-containing protein [Thermoflexales bacterium]|nr:GAF domain-containing protein [Thermoflexales bacterium]
MSEARIVIVEDERIVARDIQKRLTSLGYTIVAIVNSGEAAIQEVSRLLPDLVLMDIMLKGALDGIRAAQQIRDRLGIPVIYLTAHSDETTLQRAKLTGPFGYIVKPFEERELHISIEMALYKHHMERQLAWDAGVNAAAAELSKALISSLSLDDVSALVLEQASRLTGSAFGFVGYIDPQTGYMISPTMTRDIWESCQVADKSIVFEKLGGLWGWVLEHRQPLLTNAPRDDPRSSGVPQGHLPIQRFLGVPAVLGETLVGMVSLANSARDYGEQDLALVERLATLYALAVQRTRAEEEIRQLNESLERRVAERTAQLQAALKAKGEMLQNVSHELRTPLTMIYGYIVLLEDGSLGVLNDEQTNAVQVMRRQGDRLRFMLDRLITLQSFDAQVLNLIEWDLAVWLPQAVETWRERAASARVEFRLDISPRLPPVKADSSYLNHVLSNLLDNAIKFSPGGGWVEVRAWAEGEQVTVAVADHGVGIAPDHLDNLFELFSQADGSATRRFGGMGIGLVLCRTVVEAHGGRIWVESGGRGQGSTFYVSLPIAREGES